MSYSGRYYSEWEVCPDLEVSNTKNSPTVNFLFAWAQKPCTLSQQITSSVTPNLMQQGASLHWMIRLLCDMWHMYINHTHTHTQSLEHLKAWENPSYLPQCLSICLTLKWKCSKALRHMVHAHTKTHMHWDRQRTHTSSWWQSAGVDRQLWRGSWLSSDSSTLSQPSCHFSWAQHSITTACRVNTRTATVGFWK